jgi:hypothetical protein
MPSRNKKTNSSSKKSLKKGKTSASKAMRSRNKPKLTKSRNVTTQFVNEMKDLLNWSEYLDEKAHRLKKWQYSLSSRKPATNTSGLTKWRRHLEQREKCMSNWENHLYNWEKE